MPPTEETKVASTTSNSSTTTVDSSSPPNQSAPSSAIEEIIDWKDKFLRAKADFINLQRRSSEEQIQAVRFANVTFSKSLLDVADDFERILQVADGSSNIETLQQGVKLVYEKLKKIFKDQYIEAIECVGKPFDPHSHEALLQQLSAEHPANTVLQEVQKGYRMLDRVIRPARVIVSKSAEMSPTNDETFKKPEVSPTDREN